MQCHWWYCEAGDTRRAKGRKEAKGYNSHDHDSKKQSAVLSNCLSYQASRKSGSKKTKAKVWASNEVRSLGEFHVCRPADAQALRGNRRQTSWHQRGAAATTPRCWYGLAVDSVLHSSRRRFAHKSLKDSKMPHGRSHVPGLG